MVQLSRYIPSPWASSIFTVPPFGLKYLPFQSSFVLLCLQPTVSLLVEPCDDTGPGEITHSQSAGIK